MKQIIGLIMLVLIIGCKSMSQSASQENIQISIPKSWNILKTEGSFLIFDDGRRINTRIYEMNYLGSLTDSKGFPYFVLSGRTCKECDENIAVFIVNPKNEVRPVSELPKYTYPGREYDYENNQLKFESKLFIGNCINSYDKSFCLIWLQKSINSSNKSDSSMFIVDVYNDTLRERIIKPQTREYNKNIQLLRNCKEIKGKEITSEP